MSRFLELDEMGAKFSRALAADEKPAANAATFWYQLLGYNPKLNRALSRGNSALMYQEGHRVLGKVPGQEFAVEKLPDPICTELMNAHGGDKDGPRLISFRYERLANGKWIGGYTIETQREYSELVKSRKQLDAKFADALSKEFAPEVQSVELAYGESSWAEPGPQLVVSRKGERYASFSKVEGELRQLWDELSDHLRGHGVRHLYSASIRLDKAKSQLREGDNIQLLYCR